MRARLTGSKKVVLGGEKAISRRFWACATSRSRSRGGESLGIVRRRNGSGRAPCCLQLALADGGRVQIRGRVAALLELRLRIQPTVHRT